MKFGNAFNTFSVHRLTLISKGLGWPNGLAIDRPAGRLYWNDGQQKTIESSNLSGEDRRIVVTGVPHPYGLVIVGTHIYWTDWKTEALHRADKINGTDNTVITGKLEGLMDIRSVQVRLTRQV
jgi:sugar lactone lactonase YvrE